MERYKHEHFDAASPNTTPGKPAALSRHARWLQFTSGKKGSSETTDSFAGSDSISRPGSLSPLKDRTSTRPSSQASTRSPSSASTMKSPSVSSPFGDSPYAKFGGRKRGDSLSEAWTSVSPVARHIGSPDASLTSSGAHSPIELPPLALHETADVPETFRPIGSSTIAKKLLPDEALWISLKGGNGSWKKRQALSEWRMQLAEHEVSEAARIAELEYIARTTREAEMKKRRDRQELQRRVEEDKIKRNREKVLEEERKLRQQAEDEKQRLILADKKERMFQARPCKTCEGSGKCTACEGKGSMLTLFLAPVVNARSRSVCGQLPRGCSMCGGSGDGAWWGEFISGSGACQNCAGKCQLPAPPTGWPDCL